MPNNELEIGACYEVLQRYTCKNRVTKSKVKMTRIKYLVNGKDVGRGTYLTCLEHNETRHCKNKTEALFQMRQPWVWCDGCAQINFNTERIDQFITNYIHAVSAGKVSVDVKTSTDNNKRSKWKAYVPGWGAPTVNKRYLVKLINDWITIATYYLRVGGGYWKDDRGQELVDGVVSLWKGLEE